jgi:hypothetical protein
MRILCVLMWSCGKTFMSVFATWYVVSLREIALLSAPSGLLCGGWDFPRPWYVCTRKNEPTPIIS